MKTGIGLIGPGKRLRGVLTKLLKSTDRVEVVAATDPDSRCIEEVLKQSPEARVYDDHQQLLQDPAVQWIMIGSWNCLHAEHVIASFEAGKHVFCEKPLALSVEQCMAMREAWLASGKTFSLGLTLRYSPHYRTIKKALSEDRIGKMVSMEFNETLTPGHGGFIHMDWRRKTELAGTHLLEKCCHDLDLANWMVASLPVRVASFGGLSLFRSEYGDHLEKYGRDDEGRTPFHTMGTQTWADAKRTPFHDDKDIIDHQVAILEYANGVKATFHTNCCAAIRERRMYVLGTEGAIRGDVLSGQLEMLRVGFEDTPENLETGVKGGHGGGDTHLAETLAASMLDGVPPAASLDEGLFSAVTAFAVDEAMETGRVVDLTPIWNRMGVMPDLYDGIVSEPLVAAAC